MFLILLSTQLGSVHLHYNYSSGYVHGLLTYCNFDFVKYKVVLGYNSIKSLSEIVIRTGLNSSRIEETEYNFEDGTHC